MKQKSFFKPQQNLNRYRIENIKNKKAVYENGASTRGKEMIFINNQHGGNHYNFDTKIGKS
jgi:hypothetical protein